MMADIVEKLKDACVIDRHYGKSVTLTLDYDDYMDAADEIIRLRAENERLRAAITVAIRQHEEGNKGLAHRTLCEAVYGRQA